ncbi:MAG TPA: hypothetical protein VEJ63_11400 [Planctomycetota bacterium]|nr:hypothetical protein [Planctomycetota bacterium]
MPDATPMPQPTLVSGPPVPHTDNAPCWHGFLIAVAPLLLILGCWDAPFTSFDDGEHLNQDANGRIIGTPSLSWFVVTLQSYRLDQALFESWMPAWLGSWAPGVRLMSCVYHALAALVLWRILLVLRLNRNAALAGALLFAAHPMACESVCWVSERKNTLAALFGFLSIWSLLSALGLWRWVLSFTCFTLAMLAKPSAIGFLPVLAFARVYFLIEDANPGNWRGAFRQFAARLAPLALFSIPAFVIAFKTVEGHKEWILEPPGGSVFTALLTDLEIVSRYFGHALAPLKISTIYFVDPIVSFADSRVFMYGALLAATVSVTIWLSERRWLSALGWGWCIGAMGAHLNIIAISFWMQDRYFYMASPGFWLLVILAVDGLVARLRIPSPALRVGVAAYVALIAALGLMRGPVWQSSLTIFSDAVQKQPLAAFGHHGLGAAWGEEWQRRQTDPKATPDEIRFARERWLSEWSIAVDCPDVQRFSSHAEMALLAGEFANERGRMDQAERYWKIAAYPPPDWPLRKDIKAKALCWLALLRVHDGQFDDALALANEAVATLDAELTRGKRAQAARAWADAVQQADPEKARQLREQASADETAGQKSGISQDGILKQPR